MNSPLLIPLRKLNPVYNDHLSKSTTFSQCGRFNRFHCINFGDFEQFLNFNCENSFLNSPSARSLPPGSDRAQVCPADTQTHILPFFASPHLKQHYKPNSPPNFCRVWRPPTCPRVHLWFE